MDSLTKTSTPAAGWLPIRAYPRRGETWLDWAWCDGLRCDQPFFRDTVEAALRRPVNLALRPQTPLANLDLGDEAALPPVRALVFHASRCGSTLVSRSLAQLDGVLALSEPGVVDDVLHAEPLPTPDRVFWLRRTMQALLRQAGAEAALFKLDCWHTLHWRLFAAAFPEARRYFVVHDPLEIAVSHLRQPGWQMVPGAIPGLHDEPLETQIGWGREGYVSRTLQRIFTAGAELVSEGGAGVLDYPHLHAQIERELVPVLGVPVSEAGRERLIAALQVHAKSPGESFAGDGERKRAEASATLRAMIAGWAAGTWAGD